MLQFLIIIQKKYITLLPFKWLLNLSYCSFIVLILFFIEQLNYINCTYKLTFVKKRLDEEKCILSGI